VSAVWWCWSELLTGLRKAIDRLFLVTDCLTCVWSLSTDFAIMWYLAWNCSAWVWVCIIGGNISYGCLDMYILEWLGAQVLHQMCTSMWVKHGLMPSLWRPMYHIDAYYTIASIICCIAWLRYDVVWSWPSTAMNAARLQVIITWELQYTIVICGHWALVNYVSQFMAIACSYTGT